MTHTCLKSPFLGLSEKVYQPTPSPICLSEKVFGKKFKKKHRAVVFPVKRGGAGVAELHFGEWHTSVGTLTPQTHPGMYLWQSEHQEAMPRKLLLQQRGSSALTSTWPPGQDNPESTFLLLSINWKWAILQQCSTRS